MKPTKNPFVRGCFAATIAAPLVVSASADTAITQGLNNIDTAGNPALGAITRSTGGIAWFNTSGTATAAGTTLSNGILGPWALIGTGSATRYATLDGANVAAYTGATVMSGTGAWGGISSGGDGTVNYDISSNGTLGATGLSRNVNTIRYTGTGAIQPGNVNPSGNLLTVNGIMNVGSGEFVIGGTGGTNNYPINVTIGSARDLVLAPVTAGIRIRGAILNNGAGASAVTVAGSNTVTFHGANTYTGVTTVTSGKLVLAGGSAISDSGAGVVVSSGGTLELTSSETIGSLSGVSGASVLLTGAVTLTTGTNNSSTSFAGAISGATGNLAHTGNGTFTLSAANSYGGTTTIGAGANGSILRATATGALGSGNIVLDPTGNASTARLELAGGITLNNAILFTARGNSSTGIKNVSGNNTLGGDVTLGTGGGSYTFESESGHLTIEGDLTPPNSSSRTVFLTGAGDGEVSGNLKFVSGNTLNLTKDGAGTWTISGTGNTYTGATTVNSGTLVVNGNISTSLNTNVTGGTLKGSGVVGDLNATGGTIAPGTSIESLGAGNVSIGSDATFAYELDSDVLDGDLLYATGTLDIAGGATLTLAELASGTLDIGDKLTLISYTGAWNNGLFEYLGATLADDSVITLGSNQWLFNYNDSSGGLNFSADQAGATGFVTMTVVPEPAAALLGSLGLLGLLRRRR